MLDLHCHLLPGVDDGPPDLEVAAALAEKLWRTGFRSVAASPHMGGGPGGDVTCAAATEARVALVAHLRAGGIPLEILANGEHAIGPGLASRLAEGTQVPIGGSGPWLLVELPWGGIAKPEEAFFRLQAKGWRLLWAHPERHEFVDLGLVDRAVARGVRVQLELGSFAGVFGREAAAFARRIAERGLAHVLASDLHSPSDAETWLDAALAEVRGRYGEKAIARALVASPRAIVDGADLDRIVPFVSM